MVMVHVHHNEGFVKMVCGQTFYRLAHLVDKSHHMVAEKEMVNYKEFKMEVGGVGKSHHHQPFIPYMPLR